LGARPGSDIQTGRCAYAGRDMITAQKGMSASDAEFGALGSATL
jgi:hypothetical protein